MENSMENMHTDVRVERDNVMRPHNTQRQEN